MSAIRSFRDLQVYQRAPVEAQRVFVTTQSFPKTEVYALTDQIRRSSRAVNAMLAEAWARRRYEAAFVNKVNEALGEAMETQAWLDHALDCSYLEERHFNELNAAWQEIGAMLNAIIAKAAAFCPKPDR